MMIRMCAWCDRHLGYKEGPDRQITHGICPACYGRVFGSLISVPLADIVGRLPVPVLVMDSDAQVIAGNPLAAHALGKDPGVLASASVGDVVECANARKPGGCGRQLACTACELRHSVEDTFATGKSHARIGATLARADGRGSIEVQVTTERVTWGVLLRIDRITTSSAPATDPQPGAV
jgi:hypothetical protein